VKRYFKQVVLDMDGYASPPQKAYRVKLNQNESPFDVPASIKNELAEAAQQLAWNRYPVNESPALAEKLARRHQVQPQQILLGNGSNQLFQTLLTAALEPNDAVVYTVPTFSLYELYTDIYQGTRIEIPQPLGADYPREAMLQAIKKEQPRIVYLCSPNNPTGDEIDLDCVRRICRATDGLVFFDEAYGEFSEQTAISLIKEFDNLIISRTFSKAFSMAGLRFGYFVANAPVIEQLRKVNLPYNVNLFTELVALRLLDFEKEMAENIAYLRLERERIYAEMRKMRSIEVFPSTANFLLIRGPEGINLFHELKERGILVRDVSSYPLLHGFQRVTIGFREENDLFLSTLAEILSRELAK
jgi:histidinol-phosphate aminotransferase